MSPAPKSARRRRLTIPIHQDFDPDDSLPRIGGSPPRGRPGSRSSNSRSSSRSSSTGARDIAALTGRLRSLLDAARASGAQAARAELSRAGALPLMLKDVGDSAARSARPAAWRKEMARLRQREEEANRTALGLAALQVEADKRLGAEQQAFQRALKGVEEDLANLQAAVEVFQDRETQLLAHVERLQLAANRALSVRDTYLTELGAKDDEADHLHTKIASLSAAVKEKSELSDSLTEMVSRHTARAFVREKEMRAQVADMLSALQVQADALSERLTTKVEEVEKIQEANCEPHKVSPPTECPSPTAVHALVLNRLGPELLVNAEIRYAERQRRLEAAVGLNREIDECTGDFARELRKAKRALSFLPDALFLVNRGYTLHSNLTPGLRAQLNALTKEELLALLDCLSHDEAVRQALITELPLHTTMLSPREPNTLAPSVYE